MADPTATPAPPVARPRGRPPRITRDEVVAAAGDLSPDGLTVQAVADHLGVTRSAIYHYVESADDLVRLAVQGAAAPFRPDALDDSTWQAWLTGFAEGCRHWLLDQDQVMLRATITPTDLPWMLHLLDRGVAVLTEAGFTPETAAHALHFVAGLVWMNAHDEIVARHSADGRHPQATRIASMVRRHPESLPHLAAGPVGRPFADPAARFTREITWAIDALECQRRRDTPTKPSPTRRS